MQVQLSKHRTIKFDGLIIFSCIEMRLTVRTFPRLLSLNNSMGWHHPHNSSVTHSGYVSEHAQSQQKCYCNIALISMIF